ncbi:MAG TPA: hypothetical protein VEA92_00525 [Candidatus Paceibacterota bacterium]|nr:hypothetical protein [Candidatus Paceibacterota bacterium]
MHERISRGTAFFLIATSATFQGIGFFAGMVPILGTIWEWFGIFVMWLWLAILGVRFMSGKNALKKFGAMGGAGIIESFPLINMFPTQLLAVIWVVYLTRKEDKEKAQKLAAKNKAARQAANDNRLRAANDNYTTRRQEEAA